MKIWYWFEMSLSNTLSAPTVAVLFSPHSHYPQPPTPISCSFTLDLFPLLVLVSFTAPPPHQLQDSPGSGLAQPWLDSFWLALECQGFWYFCSFLILLYLFPSLLLVSFPPSASAFLGTVVPGHYRTTVLPYRKKVVCAHSCGNNVPIYYTSRPLVSI